MLVLTLSQWDQSLPKLHLKSYSSMIYISFHPIEENNPRKVLKDFDPVVPFSSKLNSSSILPSIFTLDLSQFNFVLEKSFQFDISIIIHSIIKPNYIKCVRLTKPVNKLLTIFKYQKKNQLMCEINLAVHCMIAGLFFSNLNYLNNHCLAE